ncbi:hypothetical protein RM553_05075 [Zunongwangia sp. F363]|uniref:PrgI family protein n=1 Tax=Autumnicola tepida TaxID=3075595 RepID=A0ABU3C783_9FLAO|nr:hypothetical protein [Zunongwangia sp. F363]MDT0642200.1 hypothetical protein [Zunongwangia sp. F363]
MKRYTAYRDIRKEALIMGLPLLLFAVQIAVVVLSLLIAIFAFDFLVILGLISMNAGLYFSLLHYTRLTCKVIFIRVYPRLISNKPVNPYSDDNDEPV